jgi:hypothetical protein
VGNTVTYEYDLGDGWMHHLELVEISTHPIDGVLPQIIGVRTHVHQKIVVVHMNIKNY